MRSALIDALILIRSYEADIRDGRHDGRLPDRFCRQGVYRRARVRILQLNGLLGDPELASFATPVHPHEEDEPEPLRPLRADL